MTTVTEIIAGLRTALANGEDLADIQDNSGEWVDGLLPVYNNHIIAEWQEMPGDYDNRGSAEFGYDGEPDIIRLMSLDLYCYYSDLFHEAVRELEAEED